MFNILTNEITIDKKEYINSFLKTLDSENSELTFTNFFMWRKSYNVRYAEVSGCLVIISRYRSFPYTVYFPIGDGNKKAALDEVISFFKNKNKDFQIRLSGENEIEMLNSFYPDEFEVIEDTDSFDYIYNIDDLSKLSGKKYHAKRNFINRFENSYNYSYYTMMPKDKADCVSLFEKWYAEKKDSVPGLSESHEAVCELLENWEKLDITGGCIRVDGEMVAFSFGEPLNKEKKTVVIHLEHADTAFDGAFPMINKQFLINEWKDYRFANREEDMGLEGLRKAKQSYYPCRMAKKYYAKVK